MADAFLVYRSTVPLSQCSEVGCAWWWNRLSSAMSAFNCSHKWKLKIEILKIHELNKLVHANIMFEKTNINSNIALF